MTATTENLLTPENRFKDGTLRLSVGSFCLNKMSQTSSTPSIFTVKKTEGLTGLQQASIRYDIWYLRRTDHSSSSQDET